MWFAIPADLQASERKSQEQAHSVHSQGRFKEWLQLCKDTSWVHIDTDLEEGTSIEELTPSDWSVGIFLIGATVGSATLGKVVIGCRKKES